ncbi:hypothetical protein [Butyrivibrio proteoclasticus]|uniref:hypothetical protein n=1 Tax=Butyrivibrio proteoclasticus TaxID=43305 RepID=UPI000478C3E1|nr:hypothetical protein [Butyrivibrio proteoclasticus]
MKLVKFKVDRPKKLPFLSSVYGLILLAFIYGLLGTTYYQYGGEYVMVALAISLVALVVATIVAPFVWIKHYIANSKPSEKVDDVVPTFNTKLRAGEYMDAFEYLNVKKPSFPKLNNVEIDNTEYTNRFKLRVSNGGSFGLNYLITEDYYDVFIERKYSILAIVFKILSFIVFLGYLFISFTYDDLGITEEQLILSFYILVPIFIIHTIAFYVTKSYEKLITAYVLKDAEEGHWDTSGSEDLDPLEESVDEVIFDTLIMVYDTKKGYFEDMFLKDPNGDIKQQFKDYIITYYTGDDDEVTKRRVNSIDFELTEVTEDIFELVKNTFPLDKKYAKDLISYVGSMDYRLSEILGGDLIRILKPTGALVEKNYEDLHETLLGTEVKNIFFLVYPEGVVVLVDGID